MDTFCVLPWYGRETFYNNKPCCIIDPDYDLNTVKKDLINGVQTSACKRCWQIERSGQQSLRQQENIFLDYKLDRDIEKLREDAIAGRARTVSYQVYVGNLCNQACVTCDSEFSSKWAPIELKMGKTPAARIDLAVDSLDIDYARAKKINLLGGETLYDRRTFEILQRLVDHNNTDCFVSLITNGSITLTDQQLELFSRFSDTNICVSIDGIGPVFEYLRWPGRWDRLVSNLEQYRKICKHLSVSYTISAVNAWYYNETVAWFNSQSLPYNHNVVSWPTWAALDRMPVEFKQLLQHQDNFISGYCEITGKENTLDMLRHELVTQDRIKNINIADYLPEVSQILKVV